MMTNARRGALGLFLLGALLIASGCSKKGSGGGGGDGGGATGGAEGKIAVSGQLGISSDAAVAAPEAAVADKAVQLVDDNGDVIAEGRTDAVGAFQIAVETGDLALTQAGTASTQRIARLRSLFLVDGAADKEALGLRQPIVIDPTQGELKEDGSRVVGTGRHEAKKVGAIFGQVTLETGEGAVGIDVFIPGTTDVAKTDATGQYLLGFLPGGTYDLRAEKTGYNPHEWPEVAVERQKTTHLAAVTLRIATGPQIDAFDLAGLDESTGTVTLKIGLRGASKFRVSKLQDFSDTTFRPFDAATTETLVTLELSLAARLVNVYLEAADSGGLSALKTLTIDRDAPRLGSVKVDVSEGATNLLTLPLKLSAVNATKMLVAESAEGLKTATAVAYAETYGYPLVNTEDGVKTIYVAFQDDAGNAIGMGGEISATVTLDRTPPDAAKLTLLPPASPTGAFNTPLAWQSTIADAASYEVEVFDNATYTGAAARLMTTAETSLNVSPALETQGTYYWRARALDASGNASDWVESGSSKRFALRVLAEAYQTKREVMGVTGADIFLAKELVSVGDLTGDGKPEIAYSIMSSSTGTCPDCGLVRIFDPWASKTLATLTEGAKKNALYGNRLVTCDMDGDGTDELVVGAPGTTVKRNAYAYKSAGAVYVYSLEDYSRVATLTNMPTDATDPAPGYGWCYNYWDGATQTNVNTCGEESDPEPMDGFAPPTQGRRWLGYEVTCMRKAGADHLLIAEPGYYSQMQGMPTGRVLQYQLSGGTLAAVGSAIEDPDHASYGQFGASVAYLANFKFTTTGTCAQAATVAIGAPNEYGGGSTANGVVHLFQLNGSSVWTECATLTPPNTDTWDLGRFGYRVRNIGDVDVDGGAIEELAVSSGSPMAGALRIYGGAAGAEIASLVGTGMEYGSLGYMVAPAGNLNGGAKELAITAPQAMVNGVPNAGKVMIYEWAAIAGTHAASAVTPLVQLTGTPTPGRFLGTTFVPYIGASGKPESMFVSSPGRQDSAQMPGMPGGGPCPPNCAGPAPGTPGMPGFSVPFGSWQEFSFLRLAPGTSTRISGSSSGAKFGAALVGGLDVDGDGAKDMIIGQPGARCLGRPWGAVSLYSVAVGEITRDICAMSSSDKLGAPMAYLPNTQRILAANLSTSGYQGMLFAFTTAELLQFTELRNMFGPAGAVEDKFMKVNSIGVSRPALATVTTGVEDYVFVGDADFDQGATKNVGRVRSFRYNGTNWMDDDTWEGDDAEEAFGASVSLLPDINLSPIADTGEVVIGSPGQDNGTGKGVVYVLDRQQAMGGMIMDTETPLPMGVLIKLKAEDAVDGTIDAQDGFGNLVLGMPDFGDYDATGTPFDAAAYIFVANTNMAHGASDAVPEYFIYAVKADGSKKLVKYETGAAGSMLGSFARLLPDINGDNVADLAVAYPGGQGLLGQTGQVQILSGKGLTTPDATDDLMQTLYNPEPSAQNFGRAVEYADMSGDGLADFVIGADLYDSPVYQNAGAVYVFPMAPVR